MFTHYHQLDQMDCGPTCLRMVAKHYGRHYTAQAVRERCNISREGVSMLAISEAAEVLGFKTVGLKLATTQLVNEAPLPCILHWGQNHFVVLTSVDVGKREFLKNVWGGRKAVNQANEIDVPYTYTDRGSIGRAGLGSNLSRAKFTIADPASEMLVFTLDEFEDKWLGNRGTLQSQGIALLLEPTQAFYAEEEEQARSVKFNQLISYLWLYKSLMIQLFLGMFAGAGLSLLLPFLTQSLVDVGIGTQNLPFVYLIVVAQAVLMISTSSVNFIRSWILLHISTRLNVSILSEFLSKLLRLPLTFFDSRHFGDIMQRIGDHHRIESFLTGHALNILFSFTNFWLFGLLLAWYSLPIFVFATLGSIIYGAWIVVFLKKRRGLDYLRFDISAKNQSQLVQLITGIQDIKLSGSETYRRWEWEGTQARLFRWNVRNLSLTQIQQAGGILINDGKNIFITFLAAKGVIDGHITLGAMVSIQYILGQFNVPLEQMLSVLQTWQDAQMSLERLNEVHALKDEESSNCKSNFQWRDSLDIQVKNVTYTYGGSGNEPVISDLSITIPHGKTTAIVGSSGSGKTTLLKLLLRFYDPDSGNIGFVKSLARGIEGTSNGTKDSIINLKNISVGQWRRGCGVVMQDGFIFSDTIARNIAVGQEVIDEERMFNAARTANIDLFIESLPLTYQTKIGLEGHGLSQGQKQRILIARAVYKEPELLLFDEATNALDSNNESIILRNLNDFFKGRTVVVVAHRLSTVKNADQIIVLEGGRVAESGIHEDLITRKGKYYELVSNQLNIGRD